MWVELFGIIDSLRCSISFIVLLGSEVFLHLVIYGPRTYDFRINIERTRLDPLSIMGIYDINIHYFIRFYQGCHHCHLELGTIWNLTWTQLMLTSLRHHSDQWLVWCKLVLAFWVAWSGAIGYEGADDAAKRSIFERIWLNLLDEFNLVLCASQNSILRLAERNSLSWNLI